MIHYQVLSGLKSTIGWQIVLLLNSLPLLEMWVFEHVHRTINLI